MTTNNAGLFSILKKALKDGPQHTYPVQDSYGDTYDLTETDFNDFELVEAYNAEAIKEKLDEVKDSYEVEDGEEWDTYSPAKYKAIKDLISQPQKLYIITDSGEGNEFVLTEAKYKAIKAKKQGDLAFRFKAESYSIAVSKDAVTIGCQSHSLDYWRNNVGTVAGRHLYDPALSRRMAEAFDAALPFLEKMTERLQTKRKPAKKASKKKAKK